MSSLPQPVRHYARSGDCQTAPTSAAELIARLQQGALFVYPATGASQELVATVQRALAAALGPRYQAPRGSVGWRCPAVGREQLSALRERVYAEPELQALAARVVASLGFPPDTRVDAPRLRVITHGAEADPAARPVYVVHRDTWYGCPQGQLNWWIPIFDTPAEQAFAFYPERFEAAVPNSSGTFDYRRWMDDVGWHGEAPLEDYPAPRRPEGAGEEVRFAFSAGDVLLFSAAQLHQTTPNPIPGTSRLSLDVRTVTGGLPEAPNVDNASTGAEERLRTEFRPLAELVAPSA